MVGWMDGWMVAGLCKKIREERRKWDRGKNRLIAARSGFKQAGRAVGGYRIGFLSHPHIVLGTRGVGVNGEHRQSDSQRIGGSYYVGITCRF